MLPADTHNLVSTGIEWLIARYKCYIMMRDGLLMNTPKLRSKLTDAKPGESQPAQPAENPVRCLPQPVSIRKDHIA